MTWALVAGIAGLAALDSINPATIAGVALILLSPVQRPALSALAFVSGAFAIVFVVGVGLHTGAEAAADALAAGTVWVRRIAFGIAAVLLAVAAVRRLRASRRAAVALPSWFGPWTAAPLGVLLTGADLPNAFPYFIAVERLVTAGIPTGHALLVLLGYAVVYCLPCLALLALGVARRDQVRARLQSLHERIGRPRTVPRSVPWALGLAGLATGMATIAVLV